MGFGSVELPLVRAQQRHDRAVCLDAVDLDLGAADHEVGVHGRVVAAELDQLLPADPSWPATAVGMPWP